MSIASYAFAHFLSSGFQVWKITISCLTATDLPRDILLKAVESVAILRIKSDVSRDNLETDDETDFEGDYSVIKPQKSEFCDFVNHVVQVCAMLGRSKFQVVLR